MLGHVPTHEKREIKTDTESTHTHTMKEKTKKKNPRRRIREEESEKKNKKKNKKKIKKKNKKKNKKNKNKNKKKQMATHNMRDEIICGTVRRQFQQNQILWRWKNKLPLRLKEEKYIQTGLKLLSSSLVSMSRSISQKLRGGSANITQQECRPKLEKSRLPFLYC